MIGESGQEGIDPQSLVSVDTIAQTPEQRPTLPQQYESISAQDRKKEFADVSVEIMQSLEENPVYRGRVFEHYFNQGNVPNEIRFTDNGFDWSVIRTGMGRSDGTTYHSVKDKELIVRRRPHGEPPANETDDEKLDREWAEYEQERQDRFYWKETLTFGADYETHRDAGGTAHYDPGRRAEFHDPEITFYSQEHRRVSKDGKYDWPLVNKTVCVEKTKEFSSALGKKAPREQISQPPIDITPKPQAVEPSATPSLQPPTA